MATPRKSKQYKDLPVDEFVNSDEHAKDIDALQARISVLEKRYGTNEQLAETLFEASQSQTKMGSMLAVSFLRGIEGDTKVQAMFKKFILETDKETRRHWLKGLGIAVIAIFTYVLGVISQALGSWLSSLIPH